MSLQERTKILNDYQHRKLNHYKIKVLQAPSRTLSFDLQLKLRHLEKSILDEYKIKYSNLRRPSVFKEKTSQPSYDFEEPKLMPKQLLKPGFTIQSIPERAKCINTNQGNTRLMQKLYQCKIKRCQTLKTASAQDNESVQPQLSDEGSSYFHDRQRKDRMRNVALQMKSINNQRSKTVQDQTDGHQSFYQLNLMKPSTQQHLLRLCGDYHLQGAQNSKLHLQHKSSGSNSFLNNTQGSSNHKLYDINYKRSRKTSFMKKDAGILNYELDPWSVNNSSHQSLVINI